jgi:hypothetical protein
MISLGSWLSQRLIGSNAFCLLVRCLHFVIRDCDDAWNQIEWLDRTNEYRHQNEMISNCHIDEEKLR